MFKIICDVDPGVDDAFALMMACNNNLLDLKGVTIVGGNCKLSNAFKNTHYILQLCNCDNISVYKGEKKSLVYKNNNAENVHGKNGFGNLKYKLKNKKNSGDAINYLIKQVNENPGEIDILAIGPLTNIAKAILKDNNFSENIKRLIVMGGSTDVGNITTDAEFNFYKDPHAVKIVLESGIKEIILLGLNVTTKLPLEESYEEYLKNSEKENLNILYKISRMGSKFDREVNQLEGFILNDPLTVAYLLNENVVQLENADVSIQTEGEKRGKAYYNFKHDGKHKVAVNVNKELFYKLLFENL